MTSSTPTTLIFVDAKVDNYQSLIQGIPSSQVVILDPSQNGIEQISQVLARHRGLQSIQIVSHGAEGSLQLGATHLTADNLVHYTAQLRQWSGALAEGADILLYGCNVAAGETGQMFVQQLSQLTGADVAASEDLTGQATKGGDWELEFKAGTVESSLAIEHETLEAYTGVLRTFNVNSYQALVDAITQANASPEDDIIQLNSDITLAGLLPVVSSSIEFVGNNYTLSGADQYRVLTVNANGGTVRLSNLTIANGRIQGTDGTDGTTAGGGNGGVGRGGGLFVGLGDVTLVNVTFQNNKAIGGLGGDSLGSSGGKGGDGFGGAVYVDGGSLRISNTSFNSNSAQGGGGGEGFNSQNGQQGQGKGGAIYVNSGATVIAERNPTFTNNQASSDAGITPGDDDNVFGSMNIVIPPKVVSIARGQAEITADAVVSYTVTFDQDVTGVDVSDFQLLTSGTIAGASMVPTVTGSGKVYTIEVNTGTGNGDLRVDLKDNDSIISTGDVPLGSTGIGNGDMTGQTYKIDKTPPTVFAINRKEAETTAADIVTYTVIFNQNVTGVNIQDFVLAANGVAGASVTEVKTINAKTYDVVVNTGTGNGQLGLNLVDDDSIRNERTVVLAGVGAGNGNFVGQVYNIDKTPPSVASINRIDPNPTNAGSVSYVVTFNQTVLGVDVSDFELVPTGVTGAGILSVTPTDGQTYTVAVNTGSGDGALRLDVKDNDSIKNPLGVALGGRGDGNGNFTGQTYDLIKNAPVVSAITLVNPNPTASNSVNYAVTFSQDVAGVDASDFNLTAVGVTDASISSVTGSGKNYNVQVNTGNGSGALGLNLSDNDSIINAVGISLGGAGVGNANFNGQAYNINKTAPRVTAINRLEANPTNAASVTFTVIFNENVIRVDALDFQLVTQGVTDASITSVTRVNNSFYTVQASTGNGDGTIGLNLIDNDSILNELGTPIGGAGVGNANFLGEVFNIDKTNPIATIVNVSPDPRQDKVNTITIQFSEAVAGFDLSDLRLTRNDQPIDLSRATLTTSDGINWTLGNIKKLTNQKGEYDLSLAAGDGGIVDAAGNPLVININERWTNLQTVDACDPGIFSRGTQNADFLVGTADKDTLLGSTGDDSLVGLDCPDRLVGERGNDRIEGNEGNDVLIGGTGNDVLIGGVGADFLKGGPGRDRFVFSGATEAEALATSTVNNLDRIRDFKFSKKDKIQLDFDNNLNSKNRPRGVFNAGNVDRRNLRAAVRAAYDDKNQVASGNQKLDGNEAVFFRWRNRTYLSVNDRAAGFSVKQDLVVHVTGIEFKAGDANAGVLSVNSYFS